MDEHKEISLSLFQFASNVVGTDKISSVSIIKDDKVYKKYSYSSTDGDKIPSVIFSLSDILPEEELISEVSEDFKDRVYLTKSKFPGII
jgi:hypothetical protein